MADVLNLLIEIGPVVLAVFCSSDKMGNLCGLGGVFGARPFLAGICLAIYAYRRVLEASHAP